ncbi:alanine--tRNA ligase [Sandaracinobacter sp. RS1-74]|uniref:alanine--tRNA ligase n=1 Tax=Sandaracinobacteroides sayramensis TaxID=2913411 RepID=UPI001EDBCF32|nr:alanine--tRNA ligase [Sandaracinobacteroides sayramensis]MCG2840994.1 alanine--tRNA ligase [Sandaracinobacteroides sayramensis]
MTSTADIRSSFLGHFEAAGHSVVPSAPLVPQNDPTLMFVNAGMVPFKNVFTGLEKRPYSQAVSSQKCVRAGGKHNDLDNVGYTARHHTFFEMLGNFSFGDYFKEQAITLAWDLLTGTWAIPKDRLTVTVYHTDDEAYALWKKIAGLPDERIIRIATSDNFWSMGDTGPCGPCSEIFYDHGAHIPGGPPGSPDEDGDRFVEVWNLVFMQFDQQPDGTRLTLPRPSIDTGMGLERIAAVLQGTHDNFEIDIFRQLIAESGSLTRTSTEAPETRASHRVIADHLRSAGFLVADGVLPANEGRGYVLRRIMRRAMRHAHLLGASEPLMHRLVPSLVSAMGGAFPELVRAQPLIAETLKLEETRFRQTLDKGLKLLDEATAGLKPGAVLPGDVAFRLYDTFGFPYDLTEDALKAQGLGVDRAGFEASMAEQKARARAAWAGSGANATDSLWFDLVEKLGTTDFIGYAATEAQGEIVAILKDGAEVPELLAGDEATILTNQTPFYAESGGQVGDTGTIATADARFEVGDTQKPLGKLHAHFGKLVSGRLKVGEAVELKVDAERRAAVKANHSATHLMHAALRRVLGEHVAQKGSLVAPDRLRFDFSHQKALTADEIAAIEQQVNAEIRANLPVGTRLMTPDAAIEAGALALFGEKYGDEVRVLSMGRAADTGRAYSVELCGGTHVGATGDIALFRIVSESAVSSGVRRIEALTGANALHYLVGQEGLLKSAAAALRTRPEELPERVATLADTVKKLERELAETKKALALAGPATGGGAEPEKLGAASFLGQLLEGVEAKALRGLVDEAKAKVESGIAVVVTVNEGRATIAVGVTDDLVGQLSAVDLVKAGVAALGGQGGGGRPDMAQGGGPDGGKGADAIAAVKASAAAALGVPA